MPNDPLEAELIEALNERLAVIGDRELRASDPDQHLVELRKASDRLAGLLAQLPLEADPQLRHFLERCSYDKALAWLEERGLTASRAQR